MQKHFKVRWDSRSKLAAAVLFTSLCTAPPLMPSVHAQSTTPMTGASGSAASTSGSVASVQAQNTAAAVVQSPAPVAAPAVAVTSAPNQASLAPRPSNRVGDATTQLLALQTGGQAASRNIHPMTSDVAKRTYERYLESFTHKIPEFSDPNVKSTGGGR